MSVRKLIVALVLVIGFGMGVGLGAQVFQAPQPVTPKVIEAPDVAFRVEGLDGETPVGHLVVKVNGRWVEARVGGIGGPRTATTTDHPNRR